MGPYVLALVLKVPYYAMLSILFGLHFPAAEDGVLIWVGEFVSSLSLMPVLFYAVSKALQASGRMVPAAPGVESHMKQLSNNPSMDHRRSFLAYSFCFVAAFAILLVRLAYFQLWSGEAFPESLGEQPNPSHRDPRTPRQDSGREPRDPRGQSPLLRCDGDPGGGAGLRIPGETLARLSPCLLRF